MKEWIKSSKRESYKLSQNNFTCYVWLIFASGWHWNVYDETNGCYIGSGICVTIDDACEAAMKKAGI